MVVSSLNLLIFDAELDLEQCHGWIEISSWLSRLYQIFTFLPSSGHFAFSKQVSVAPSEPGAEVNGLKERYQDLYIYTCIYVYIYMYMYLGGSWVLIPHRDCAISPSIELEAGMAEIDRHGQSCICGLL